MWVSVAAVTTTCHIATMPRGCIQPMKTAVVWRFGLFNLGGGFNLQSGPSAFSHCQYFPVPNEGGRTLGC